MAFDDRLITVAVHTCEVAVQLKETLEQYGIYATLQNINLEHPVISSGMRVRIKESDLPRALLIIESDDITFEKKLPDNEILVPIDFSDYSVEACKVAVQLASAHNASVTLLHAHNSVSSVASKQLSDALTYDVNDQDAETDNLAAVRQLVSDFKTRVGIDNCLPNVHISEIVVEGLPEEVIADYCKRHTPTMIVMGTRGADKKGKESIGSVTAEVLDTCRRPVMTVPEGFSSHYILDADNVLFFCRGEQTDILALQRIRELFKPDFRQIILSFLKTKKYVSDDTSTLDSLAKYCEIHYPEISFVKEVIDISSSNEITRLPEERGTIHLIAVSSKRKSALARLFNPGLAHRLLFRADIPMLVIPV